MFFPTIRGKMDNTNKNDKETTTVGKNNDNGKGTRKEA